MLQQRQDGQVSLSLRRAWIEIHLIPRGEIRCKSLSLRRAWIEMSTVGGNPRQLKSLSLRRAWIEIHSSMPLALNLHVALLTESVD